MFSRAIWWSDETVELYQQQNKLKIAFRFDPTDGSVDLLSSVYEYDFDSTNAWTGHHRFVEMRPLQKWHVLDRIVRVNSFYRTVIEKKVIASNIVRKIPIKFKP